MYQVVEKQGNEYQVYIKIVSDNPEDLVQAVCYEFNGDQASLYLDINQQKWDPTSLTNQLSLIKASLTKQEEDFLEYFDGDGREFFGDFDEKEELGEGYDEALRGDKKQIFFITEFKDKLDTLMLALEKEGLIPQLLGQELAIMADDLEEDLDNNRRKAKTVRSIFLHSVVTHSLFSKKESSENDGEITLPLSEELKRPNN